jgi:hypothetical protein
MRWVYGIVRFNHHLPPEDKPRVENADNDLAGGFTSHPVNGSRNTTPAPKQQNTE